MSEIALDSLQGTSKRSKKTNIASQLVVLVGGREQVQYVSLNNHSGTKFRFDKILDEGKAASIVLLVTSILAISVVMWEKSKVKRI